MEENGNMQQGREGNRDDESEEQLRIQRMEPQGMANNMERQRGVEINEDGRAIILRSTYIELYEGVRDNWIRSVRHGHRNNQGSGLAQGQGSAPSVWTSFVRIGGRLLQHGSQQVRDRYIRELEEYETQDEEIRDAPVRAQENGPPSHSGVVSISVNVNGVEHSLHAGDLDEHGLEIDMDEGSRHLVGLASDHRFLISYVDDTEFLVNGLGRREGQEARNSRRRRRRRRWNRGDEVISRPNRREPPPPPPPP